MWRSLCKDYDPGYIIEQLAGFQKSDLTCIHKLCHEKSVDKCCKTITDLTNAMQGQTPGTLRIDADAFNNMAAITDGSVGEVDENAVEPKPKPGPKPWEKPKPNKPVVEKPTGRTKEVGDKPWAAKLGWNKDGNGHFHYSSGGEKADPNFVPPGCHAYAGIDLCFPTNHGTTDILKRAKNEDLDELRCVGYLCNHYSNEKCCGTLTALKSVINGKNWHELGEYEDKFDDYLRATGEYLQ